MPKPSKLQEIERREGKPMRQILQEKYAEHGNQTRVAVALGVSQGRVSQWIRKLKLQEKTTLVESNDDRA